jgi:hypothetical protein
MLGFPSPPLTASCSEPAVARRGPQEEWPRRGLVHNACEAWVFLSKKERAAFGPPSGLLGDRILKRRAATRSGIASQARAPVALGKASSARDPIVRAVREWNHAGGK